MPPPHGGSPAAQQSAARGETVPQKQLPAEALLDIRRRLSLLPPRSPQRRQLIQATAQLYGVSEDTLYRILRDRLRPRAVHRADRGQPRVP